MLQPDNAPEASSKISFPDIIGIVEVENAGVIEDLARFELSKRGYYWTAFTALSGSSLGIGILSRFPINDVRAHSITVGKDTAPRPVLEVRIEPGGKPIVVLLCHWKSKLGDNAVTESIRRSSARVVSRRVRELSETEPDTPVIVMGDLNENHDEFYRQSGKVFSALLPDDPAAAALANDVTAANGFSGNREEFLVLSGEKPPVASSFPHGNYALYSPWQEEMTEGSYWYRDEWETIDHFLLSENLFNGAGWNYDSFRVARHAPFTRADGVPNTYVPRFGRGVSDHLPLLLYLRYAAED
jgi:endonuclease/exonuclease/phosphatase family metal-dependent hydrolase